MAAGAFRAGGAPGLFVTTLGPGLANMVNGIADAGQEGVPLIVLTGRWSSDRSGGTLYRPDHQP
jgi:acetolactate synthase-1/2/3 large subunit